MATKFRVKTGTTSDNGYAGRRYGGMIGESRYPDKRECRKLTGYPFSLKFPNGRTDGFYENELEPVD